MLGDLFDSPWKILIIAIVVLVLFGSRKMPDAARSLGRSMRILKAEMQEMHEDGANGTQAGQPPQQAAPQPLAAPAPSVPVTPVATADGMPVAAQAAPAAAPVPPAAPAAAPPASVPVPEVQQDTRPA
jgi:sec-independent protein translocase protein TatA